MTWKRRRTLLAVPTLLWIWIFVLIPLCFVFLFTFMSRDEYGNLVLEWTLEHYARLMEPVYIQIFLRTCWITLLSILLCLLLGYPVAYTIARLPRKWQQTGLILILIPFWINFLIRAYVWVLLLRTQGALNSALLHFSFITEPLQFLYNPNVVLLGMVYCLLPFMILPLYISIRELNPTLLEAAYDLGASPAQAFLRVTLPQTTQGIFTGIVFVFISSMGMYAIPDILGGAKSMMMTNLIQTQFLGARNWPFGAVLTVVMIGFSLIFIGSLYYALLAWRKAGAQR